jgi:GTP cyclohydrolase I
MDLTKMEAGFRLVLEGLGVDGDHPQLLDTPARTAKAWVEELCAGYGEPAVEMEVFPVEEGSQGGLVALSRIPVKSVCAHHLLPFQGEATVAYIPGDHICGLSRLSRVVNHFARRLQMQETLTHQIARYLEENLQPIGVGVVIRAEHFCMQLRGVNHPGIMTTSSMLGALQDDPTLRAEFLAVASQPDIPGPDRHFRP